MLTFLKSERFDLGGDLIYTCTVLYFKKVPAYTYTYGVHIHVHVSNPGKNLYIFLQHLKYSFQVVDRHHHCMLASYTR